MKFTSSHIGDSVVHLGKIQNSFFKTECLTEAELAHHVHVVGASGFGKTVLLSHIIKQRIQTNQGLLYIDLKGDIDTINKYTQMAKASGRANDLQIFSLANIKSSLPYNLIADGTATQLRDRIMMSLNWSEEYYKNQAASFLLKVLIGLVYLRDNQNYSFGLSELLRVASDKSYLEELVLKIPTSPHHRQMLEDCYLFLKENGNYNSLQGLRTQLESLVLSDFGELISSQGCGAAGAELSSQGPVAPVLFASGTRPFRNDISLFETVTKRKICFLFLDSRRYGETAKTIGKFILQDLKAVSAKVDSEIAVESRHPFTVVIDEFADLASEDFIGFLDRARSSKIAIVVAHQELADLNRISPEFAGRLQGNCSTIYAFLQKMPESAEMIASFAGTRSVWKTTHQTDRFLFFNFISGKGSQREVEEFNIHPNIIKSLRVGECVVVKKYPKASAYLLNVFPDGK